MNWNTIPTFDDESAKVVRHDDTPFGAPLVEVLYGATDADGNPVAPAEEGDADGHGTWAALEVAGEYRLLSWRRPASEGGGTEFGFGMATDPRPLLEADIAKKEGLVQRMQQLLDSEDWSGGGTVLRQTMDEWRATPNWHTPREDALWEEFQSRRKAFYDRRSAVRDEATQRKRALIERAKSLADSTEWKATAEMFHDLMDQWKAAGSAGHEEDERLWEQYNTYQHAFYNRRSEHYQQMRAEHAANKKAKQALIAEAREVVQPSPTWSPRQWKEANARMRDLMGAWKQVGPVDREDSDRLWDEFNGLRQRFFDAQHAHHEEVEAQQDANAAAKQELIDTARRIAAEEDYSAEATQQMRDLDVRWKALGYAGSARNDALWDEFRTAKESFWEARRARNDERHAQWLQKTQEALERKRGQIESLNGQIDRLQDRIDHATVMVSESRLNEWAGWIDEKKERIAELERQVADIEQKLK